MNVTEAQEKLESGVTALVTSHDWLKALQTAAKFHQYSFGNAILIELQHPGATRVAGFHRWLALGRHVKRGEHGIAILAPLVMKVKAKDPVIERTRYRDYNFRRADELEEQTKKTPMLRGFRVVHVFDISQTEGHDLSTPEQFAIRLQGGGETELELFTKLATKLRYGLGYTVERSDPPSWSPETNGETNYADRHIAVRYGLSPVQSLKTLMHEYAHAHLHENDPRAREIKECEAESAAYIALQVLGIESASYSFGYVAGWSGGQRAVIELAGRHAQSAAKQILSALGLTEKEEAA